MKQIALTGRYGRGKFALVDDGDFELLNQRKWHVDSHGYATRCVSKTGPRIYMARLIMGEPKGLVIDHIDHNPLNNQRSNLRICPRGVNSYNKRNEMRGSSKYKGVFRVKPENNATNPYTAHIKYQDRNRHIGCFPTEEAAARAYNEAAKKYFGEFACLNEVPEEAAA